MNNRHAWACAACGNQVYPTAGMIVQDTRTPLQSWFYAIYLFVTTRHGVSAKELQRQLGVTYKTAWRIGHKIREQMDKHELKAESKPWLNDFSPLCFTRVAKPGGTPAPD